MSNEAAQRHYRGKGAEQYHGGKRFIPERTYPWVARLRARKFARYVNENTVVLEYGVGAGWNLAELECKRRIGSDISEFVAETVAAHDIEFVQDTTSIPPASIDVVISHHTLEHALQPTEMLQEIFRLLRPGGTLLLHVPFERERRYRRFQRAEPNHHLYSWNVQTLGNLVEELKFRVKEAGLSEFGYDRFAAVWADKLRLNESGFRMIRKLVHLFKPGYEVRIVASKP